MWLSKSTLVGLMERIANHIISYFYLSVNFRSLDNRYIAREPYEIQKLSFLEQPRYRWENNIRMDLKEIRTRSWVDSAEDRDYWRALLNAALNLLVS